MKLSKIILSIFVISSLQATSLVKVECDVRGEQIYLDGEFKAECDNGELVKLLAPAGRHTIKAVKYNKDGSYYKFVKIFRLGDKVEKIISVDAKLNYTETYYYKNAFNSLSYAKIYLEKYPHGKHSKEIKNYWDRKYFSRCNTISGCQNYLNNISWGKYIKAVREKLENMYYERANTDIYYADKYVNLFPKGKYISDIKNIIDNYYWKKCQDLNSCKIYIKKVSYGKHIKQAKEILKNTWFKTYGGSKKDELWVHSFVETKDGYVLAGYSKSYTNGAWDGWIFKIDKNGNKLWQNHFGGKKNDEFNGIVATDDGFMISGWTQIRKNNIDGWILKIDQKGNKIWENKYGGDKEDYLGDILYLRNNRYISVGNFHSHNIEYGFLLNFYSNGKTINKKFLKRSVNKKNSFSSIYRDKNNLFLIGYSIKSTKNGWIVKMDKNENILWNRVYKSSKYEKLYNMIKAKNGYLVVGIHNKDNRDGLIMKIDNKGNQIWKKTYGGDKIDGLSSIIQIDNGYLVAGGTFSKGNGKCDVWLVKIDENGNKIWEKTFGGRGIDFTWGLFKDKEGNLIIPATTASYGSGDEDAWIIKISKELLKKWDEDTKAIK